MDKPLQKLVVGMLVVFGLAGCGTSAGGPSSVVTETVTKTIGSGQAIDSDSPAPTEPETEAPSSSDSSSDNASFGKAFTYKDGLVVAVAAPKSFQLSDTSLETKKHTHHLKFRVTITNNTGKNYDPSLFSTTLQSGSDEGEEVFDTDRDLNGSPDTSLLPGRSVKFSIGYGVNDEADLVLEVTPGFEYNASIYTS